MVQTTPAPGTELTPTTPARPPKRGVALMGRRRWLREVGWRHLIGVIAVLWSLFPITYIVSAAFNPAGSVTSSSVIPTTFSSLNFHKLFQTSFPTWVGNSLIVCATVTFVQILFSALAAYAFSRLRFAGRRGGLMALLLIQMFPQFLAVVALYLMFSDIGTSFPMIGLNTLLGYILMMCGNSLGQVWLIKGFFDTVPRTLDEAAMIDGASHVQTFFRILLPLIRPVLAVCALLVFIGVIGDYLLASIFLTDTAKKTVAVGLYGLISGSRSQNLGVFCAGALLTAVPVMILFLFLQRFIVGGVTAGGVKE